MPQKIEIISNAMILIGTNAISDLSEGTEGAVANALYDNTYEGLLASHSWRFATKKVQLARLTDSPLNEFSYQFQIPSNSVNIIKVYNGGDYEIYGDKIYSNDTEMSIDYVYRVDETLLPPHFTLALQFLLAAQFAIPVTDNSQRAAVMEGLYERQLARAKHRDSSERPQDAIQHQPLNEAMQ